MSPRSLHFLVLAALCGMGAVSNTSARGLPAREGILNFGKVSDHVYRGAQPDENGIKNLRKLGIKLIINLRMPGDSWMEEPAEAMANGIIYTNFPMSGAARPNDEQVRQILALVESSPEPVFIHCQHGCDRTGTIIACYRIQHDRWSYSQSMHEAKHYGISRFEFVLKRYVSDFALTSSPGLYADLRQARAN